MPYLAIHTNVDIDPSGREALLSDASHTVANQLGKAERYVMTSYRYNGDMLFAASTAPLAYVELKSIGLPGDQTTALSHTLCQLLGRHLNVAADRIYIEFSDAEPSLWGWNGRTF